MASIKDDRGYNQGFKLVQSTVVRMQRRTDLILSEMNPAPNRTVLEIGCGTGEVSYWLASKSPLNILGTDICVPFIETAQKKYQRENLKFEVLDFNSPDQINGRRFDYIIGNGILHHLYYNLDQALVTIRGLLNRGGKMIFMEPNIYNPYCAIIFNFTRQLASLEPDEMAFSRRYISKKLKEAGYSMVSVSYRDFLVPGVPSFMIKPSIFIGDLIERMPLVNALAQSLFIVARAD
jgi:2-polyprenyl-3-methyl-5-hydroxy-6-metoxy-1,4-benzoquinol methylase